MADVHCCAIVPTYDNAPTIRRVIEGIRKHLHTVIVVDDASHEPGRAACQQLAADGLASVVRLDRNQGKGAAVKAGLRQAHELGFSHAFQIDADGQHDLEAIPDFLQAMARAPESAILGYPVYDGSAPKSRLIARRLTRFWVDLETRFTHRITDALIGFRIYPVQQTLALNVRSNRMEFDVEIAVRLAWADVPIINRPVRVRYLTNEEGGISHFHPFFDNLRLAWMHSRLCTMACTRWALRKLRFTAGSRIGHGL